MINSTQEQISDQELKIAEALTFHLDLQLNALEQLAESDGKLDQEKFHDITQAYVLGATLLKTAYPTYHKKTESDFNLRNFGYEMLTRQINTRLEVESR